MTPFKIEVPQTKLDSIRARVRDYEWHEMPRGEGLEGTWAYGANLEFMQALCTYWLENYDWRKWETALNRFPQFKAPVEDIELHFYKETGSGSSPKPLILSHGWPGSVFEFLHVIDYAYPAWAKTYMENVRHTLGEAYGEPAKDVEGYIAYVKSQKKAS